MSPRSKWGKIIATGAIAATVATIVFFALLLIAMLGQYPIINPFPVLIAACFGVALSVIGLWQTSREPRQLRSALFSLLLIVINGTIILFIFEPWVVTVEETVIVPEGFMGTAMIVYGVPTGGSLERDPSGPITYRVPSSGRLLIQDVAPEHWSYRRRYFFQQHNGSLVPITAHWYTTIHETDSDFLSPTIGTYLESGIGEFSPANSGCRIRFQGFVIGTKQFIRSGGRVTEPEMLRRMNLSC